MKASVNMDGKPAREYEILKQLQGHSHIVKAYSFYGDNGRVILPNKRLSPTPTCCMSMELCTHGDLCDFLISNGPINDELLLKHLAV